MVSQIITLTKDLVAKVERIEVHIKSVNDTICMGVDDYGTRSGPTDLSTCVRLDAVEPCRVFCDIVDRC